MNNINDLKVANLIDAAMKRRMHPQYDFPKESNLVFDLPQHLYKPENNFLLQRAREERIREIRRRCNNGNFETWGELILGMNDNDFNLLRGKFDDLKTDIHLMEHMEAAKIRALRIYEEPNRLVVELGSDKK